MGTDREGYTFCKHFQRYYEHSGFFDDCEWVPMSEIPKIFVLTFKMGY